LVNAGFIVLEKNKYQEAVQQNDSSASANFDPNETR